MARPPSALLLSGLLCAVCVGFGGLLPASVASPNPYRAWDTLARAFYEVKTRYVDEVDDTRLLYAALAGLTDALDAHSLFLSPEEYRRLREEEEGRYFGIGAELRKSVDGLQIVVVFPDSPAALVGLREGDVLVSADGNDLATLPFDDATEHLVGPRGTPVELTYSRDGARQDVSIVRDWVHVPVVMGRYLGGGVGLLRIAHFREGAGHEVRDALGNLAQAAGAPLRGVVMDLRDNPGGLLTEAVAVTDFFVGDEVIVRTRGRGPGTEEELRGAVHPDDLAIPVVVLVNRGSASAAEIVAGALRDLRGAHLVGTRTFGKGSVQTLWVFEDESALKLTVGRYILPSGRTIEDGRGLEPDLLVESPADQARTALLARLEAEVEKAQQVPDAERVALRAALRAGAAPIPRRTLAPGLVGPVSELLAGDPQLAAAMADVQRVGGLEP